MNRGSNCIDRTVVMEMTNLNGAIRLIRVCTRDEVAEGLGPNTTIGSLNNTNSHKIPESKTLYSWYHRFYGILNLEFGIYKNE